MMRTMFSALAAVLAVVALSNGAEAGERRVARHVTDAGSGAHPKSSYYRRGPQVKGFVARRGGYSYVYPDAINTYGDARTKFGGASSLRDPMLDRQTNAGPFDHGYFFDSGVAPRGGDSPYMN